MYLITCVLPDGKNYFCGMIRKIGIEMIEWDTEIDFAFGFKSSATAENYLELRVKQKDETFKVEFFPEHVNQNTDARV
jgi:hypothetical protein